MGPAGIICFGLYCQTIHSVCIHASIVQKLTAFIQ